VFWVILIILKTFFFAFFDGYSAFT